MKYLSSASALVNSAAAASNSREGISGPIILQAFDLSQKKKIQEIK